MNPDSPKTPRDKMEARLTALLLGELPENEAAELHALLKRDAELAALHERLKQTLALVRETAPQMEVPPATAESLKLSEERRQRLLAAFKIPPLKEKDRKPKRGLQMRWIEVLAVVAIVAVLAAFLFPVFTEKRLRANVTQTDVLDVSDVKAQYSYGREKVGVFTTATTNGASSMDAVGYGNMAQHSPPIVTKAASMPAPGAHMVSAMAGAPNVEWSTSEESRRASLPTPLTAAPQRAPVQVVLPSASAAPADSYGLLAQDERASRYNYDYSGESQKLSTQEPALNWYDRGTVAPTTAPRFAGSTTNYASAGDGISDNFAYKDFVTSGGGGGVNNRGSITNYAVTASIETKATNGLYFGSQLLPQAQSVSDGSLGYALSATETAAPQVDPATGLPVALQVTDENTNAVVVSDLPLLGRLFRNGGSPEVAAGEPSGTTDGLQMNKSLDRATRLPAGTHSDVKLQTRTYNESLGTFFTGIATNDLAGLRGVPNEDQTVNLTDAISQQNVAGLRFFSRTNSVNEADDLSRVTDLLSQSPNTNRDRTLLDLNGRGATDTNSAAPDLGKGLVAAISKDEKYAGSIRDREKASPESVKSVPSSDPDVRAYEAKKRELDGLWGFSRILSTKLASERIDANSQRQSTSMVEIMDKATPPQSKTGFLSSFGGGSYASKARVKVERDIPDIEGLAGSRSLTAYDPYFIQTEFEAVQSEAVLGKVVDSLKLDEKWAKERGVGGKLKKEEAIKLLKSKLELKPVDKTSLIEIRSTSSDAEEAARIANAVAEAYKDFSTEQRLRMTTTGIRGIEDRYQVQQEKIKKAQVELEALRMKIESEAEVPVPRKPSTNAPIPQPEIQVSENAFSTFSLNVSDVSFKLAAASLEKGQMPDAASIRSEEFINAFDYRDPDPSLGAPIAFTWERSRYPFAHNRDLLRFSLKTAAAGRQAGRSLNIVLLLDNSGSMERADRVQIVREALRVLAAQLQPQDKLSVITFARTPRLVAEGISGDKAGELVDQVSGLTPQGGTNLEEAMNLAYQTALKHYLTNGVNRVILLTDGAANLGNVDPESLKQKVETNRKQGIALDCFGIGWEGYNDDLLEVLSRNGDGRYGFINSPQDGKEFASQLAGALTVAASDVKVQVEFNPKRTTTYRQIGYAKHQLTKEQFRDNTVDAAEIAAQEAGNALYTVEVNPTGEGPICTVHVRYKIPGTTDYREQAWDVPYNGNALLLEQASPAMRLATSASAFSEWLAANPFSGEVTLDRLLNYLRGVPEIYGADARPQKLEWMIRQAKSLEGK